MSFLRSLPRSRDIRSTLQGLRSRVLAAGAPLYFVVGPDLDREDFDRFEDADNRAVDLASAFPGQSFFAQERRSLTVCRCFYGRGNGNLTCNLGWSMVSKLKRRRSPRNPWEHMSDAAKRDLAAVFVSAWFPLPPRREKKGGK